MLVKYLLMPLVPCWFGLQEAPPDAPPPDAVPQPKLVVVGEQTLQLDKIREGDKVNAVFVLENQGEADLVIDHVKSGCGCTVVELADNEKVVPPGQRQQIVARFDSAGRPGFQTKSVTVYSNDRENPRLQLTFKVEVQTLFETIPSIKYDFRNVRRGERFPRPIDIIPTMVEGPMQLVSFKIPGTTLRHTIEPLPEAEEGRGYRVFLTADEDAELGLVQAMAEITVKIGDETETRKLQIQGKIAGDFEVKPPIAKLERPAVRGTHLRQLEIGSFTEEPFDIFEASAGTSFVVTIEPAEDRTKYKVDLQISEEAADGPCGAFLEVRTDSIMQPLLRVPVFAYVAPRVNIEPPLVLLRSGPTPGPVERRVALQTATGAEFNILGVATDLGSVEAAETTRDDKPAGGRFLLVSLKQGVAAAEGHGTLTVKTDVPGAEVLKIPVVVTGPKATAQAQPSG